jgi:hypothetical protein
MLGPAETGTRVTGFSDLTPLANVEHAANVLCVASNAAFKLSNCSLRIFWSVGRANPFGIMSAQSQRSENA